MGFKKTDATYGAHTITNHTHYIIHLIQFSLLSTLQLSTFLLSTFYFPLSTFHFLLSTFHFTPFQLSNSSNFSNSSNSSSFPTLPTLPTLPTFQYFPNSLSLNTIFLFRFPLFFPVSFCSLSLFLTASCFFSDILLSTFNTSGFISFTRL